MGSLVKQNVLLKDGPPLPPKDGPVLWLELPLLAVVHTI